MWCECRVQCINPHMLLTSTKVSSADELVAAYARPIIRSKPFAKGKIWMAIWPVLPITRHEPLIIAPGSVHTSHDQICTIHSRQLQLHSICESWTICQLVRKHSMCCSPCRQSHAAGCSRTNSLKGPQILNALQAETSAVIHAGVQLLADLCM